MKKRKFVKKISVSRETLQRLEAPALREALAGAYTLSTCTCIQGCHSGATCPP